MKESINYRAGEILADESIDMVTRLSMLKELYGEVARATNDERFRVSEESIGETLKNESYIKQLTEYSIKR